MHIYNIWAAKESSGSECAGATCERWAWADFLPLIQGCNIDTETEIETATATETETEKRQRQRQRQRQTQRQ